jgi:hypothetical protein
MVSKPGLFQGLSLETSCQFEEELVTWSSSTNVREYGATAGLGMWKELSDGSGH